MEPIISPWVFYAISTLSNLKSAFIGLGIVLILSSIAIYVSNNDPVSGSSFEWQSIKLKRSLEYIEGQFQKLVEMYEQSSIDKERFNNLLKDIEVTVKEHEELYNDMRKVTTSLKNGKRNFILGITLLILAILIPSTDTMYKMLITSYITPENIQTGATITNSIVQQLIDKIVEAAKAIK